MELNGAGVEISGGVYADLRSSEIFDWRRSQLKGRDLRDSTQIPYEIGRVIVL